VRADAARSAALDRLLHAPLGRVERDEGGDGPEAARARELFAGVRRHLFTIDEVLDRHLPKGVARVEPRLREALRLGTYQLLYERQVAKPLVVASTVALAGPSARKRGFLNAVLRKIAQAASEETGDLPRRRADCVIVGRHAFARFSSAVLPDPDEDLVDHLCAQFTQTRWFVEAMMREVGEEIDDLLLALALPLPLAMRANALKGPVEGAEAALVAAGAAIARRFGDVLEVRLPGSIAECEPFRAGLVTVQDVVASSVAPFVGPKPGERILDLCAGAGGKALQLSEVAGGQAEVVATDVSEAQLARLRENLARLGTPGVRALRIDDGPLPPMPPFDRVLVDAPCSNSGVLMKRVAARFRINADAVLALAARQLELLGRGAAAVRPGGVLVYATCSILPHENGAVVERFLAQQAGAFVLEAQQTAYPHRTGRDGGFMARLVRR
jgi:16S rRNA (cytosine967-C5)-methyltransferase